MIKHAAWQHLQQAQPAITAPRQHKAATGAAEGGNLGAVGKTGVQRVIDQIADKHHAQMVDAHHRKATGAGRHADQIGLGAHAQALHRIQPTDPQTFADADAVDQFQVARGINLVAAETVLCGRGRHHKTVLAQPQADQIRHPAKRGFCRVVLHGGLGHLPIIAQLKQPQIIGSSPCCGDELLSCHCKAGQRGKTCAHGSRKARQSLPALQAPSCSHDLCIYRALRQPCAEQAGLAAKVQRGDIAQPVIHPACKAGAAQPDCGCIFL